MEQNQMSEEYWAATTDLVKLANSMKQKISGWRNFAAGAGLIALWQKKLRNYYGTSVGGNSSQAVTKGGAEGELNMIKINDLHALIQDQLVTVTSQRPAGVAKAINSNTDALKSAKIGTGVAEYYMTEEEFEKKFVSCAESALLCDEAFIDLFWDKDDGDDVAADHETGEVIKSGDLVMRNHCTWNVARDPGITVENNKWHIISMRGSKYDLAAKWPKFANAILYSKEDGLPSIPMNYIPEDSDAIWYHLLVHDRTAALPEGRYAVLIDDTIVANMKLPYPVYPVERMAPSDVIDGCTGYAPSTDILAAEEVTDALHSIAVTNLVNFGGQNIVGPKGANLNIVDLAKGTRYFELEPDLVDKLRALNLLSMSPEVFNYISILGQKKERAVGSVSGLLAQQAAQGASGNSMALIQTQSISFNSGTQRSYYALLSNSMTKAIRILAKYADTPKVARIVGKSKSAGMKEFRFTGDSLSAISSVVYELVNPASQTYGGRLQMADNLLKAGQVKSPKQYINLVATAQPDVLDQDDEADGMLILEENEALQEGREVTAVITEIHVDHIKSHNSLITQEAKEKDPEMVRRVLDHVQHHLDLWTEASIKNPGILLATGQQPLFPPQGQAMPGALQPGAPGGDPEQTMGGTESPVEMQAEEVGQPSLPNIAGTDEKPTIPGVPADVA